MQPLGQSEKTSYLPAFRCRIVAACRFTQVAGILLQYAGVAPRRHTMSRFVLCYAIVIFLPCPHGSGPGWPIIEFNRLNNDLFKFNENINVMITQSGRGTVASPISIMSNYVQTHPGPNKVLVSLQGNQ